MLLEKNGTSFCKIFQLTAFSHLHNFTIKLEFQYIISDKMINYANLGTE